MASSKFIIEVTERGIPDRLGIDELNDAYNSGVRIALDDVWVSNGNPVIMCRTRADILKIDKAFIDQMLLESWSPNKMLSLSNLVRTSDIDVIAEGVESDVQVEILREAGIHMAQGWYFSHPLSAKRFEAFFYANK